jgi:hypothetical protein
MFTFIAPILRHRFVAFAKYRTNPTNKKARTAAGLFGRVDRLSVSVPVALDADCHMGDVSHRAVVEVKRVAISRYPIDKTDASIKRVVGVPHVAAEYAHKCALLLGGELG